MSLDQPTLRVGPCSLIPDPQNIPDRSEAEICQESFESVLRLAQVQVGTKSPQKGDVVYPWQARVKLPWVNVEDHWVARIVQ